MVGAVAAPAAPPTSAPAGGDWPMWGGSPGRNAVNPAATIPTDWDLKTGRNVQWKAALGTYSYGGPVVAGGRVFVGTNNAAEYRSHSKGDRGCLLCFEAAGGSLLWQATHEKLPSGSANDWPEQGVASTPYVAGNRVYYVSNRCELVCADAEGFYDGENDGPFTGEKFTERQDADFVWVLDMIAELGVYPCLLAACSPVGADDLVFVCTGNGVDDDKKPRAPQAPSFVAVHKQTGKVVWKRNDPGENILNGQWASPAYGVIAGRPQVIFGGGDGWCYAFDPTTGEPLWKFNLNPPDSVWKPGGAGTKTSIVATPVVFDDRVLLAVGDEPEAARGPGHLYAIDATKTGDVTETGKVWHYGGEDFRRTLSSVAVAGGRVYAADLDGYLHCLDIRTGQRQWRYDMESGVWASPAVLGDRVLLGNTDGELVVLEHGAALREVARHDMGHAIYTPAVFAGGTLYVVTQRFLYALGTGPASAPAAAPAAGPAAGDWPMFRGDRSLAGVAKTPLPERLHLRWKYEARGALSSTAAIAGGVAYVGCEEDALLAVDLKTGQRKWEHRTEGAVESSPCVAAGLVISGDEAGVVHACDAASGAVRWTFKAGSRVISSATVVGDRVVFGSYDRSLYCLNAADGRLVWRYETDERIHGTPAIMDSYVLIAGCDAHLHVVALTDGTAIRQVPLGAVTGCSPAVCGARVFLGTYGQQVLGIDWQAGRVVWRFEDQQRPFPFLSSAAVTDELVIIGGRDARVRALGPATGEQKWQFVTKGEVDSSPVVVGQCVFVGSRDGNVYALRVADGTEAWRYETGSPISASPAVGEGCLVIGSEDGLLYCFSAEP